MGGFLGRAYHRSLVPLDDLHQLLGQLWANGVVEVDPGRLPHLVLQQRNMHGNIAKDMYLLVCYHPVTPHSLSVSR